MLHLFFFTQLGIFAKEHSKPWFNTSSMGSKLSVRSLSVRSYGEGWEISLSVLGGL